LINPELVETRTVDPDTLVGLGFVAGTVVVSVLGGDWKYEHPESARAVSRIRERMI
jgi:hypothetical protein